MPPKSLGFASVTVGGRGIIPSPFLPPLILSTEFSGGLLAGLVENIRKHRIDFADVPMIFNSPMLIELDDRFNYDEDRWIGIGFLRNGVVVIVWTERQDNIIRIISARRANRYEIKRLKQYLAY